MKSLRENNYASVSNEYRQKIQGRINMEERRRIEERRRLRAKKRFRARMMRFAFKSILVLGILTIVTIAAVHNINKLTLFSEKKAGGVGIPAGDGTTQVQEGNKVINYEVGKPLLREGIEVKTRLKSLSEEYPNFTEIYNNMDAYPQDLISSLCNNPEMIDFVKGYLTSDRNVSGGLNDKEMSEDYPLLLQWDKRWGYVAYGDYDIGLSGCAPTCLSMVIVALTKDRNATPDVVADYAMTNGFYISGTGTTWSLMTEGSRHFGIQGKEISLNSNTIKSELKEGHPIICSMKPGDFTTTGHFIVLVGVNDGKIEVRDPNCKERSNRLWNLDQLEPQIKNLWAFSK